MLQLLWYFTLSSSIWGTYFGSFSTFFGEVYPFQILVITNTLMIIFRKDLKVNKIIKISLLLFMVIFIYGVTSIFWANDILISIKKITHYLFGILFLFQFCVIVNNYSRFKQTIRVFSLNYYLVLIISLIEQFTGNYLHATHYIQTNNLNSFGLHFPLVMFNNTNDLAVFLFLFSPVAISILLNLESFKKISVILVYSIITFIIFNTESRLGSFLIVVYGGLFLLFNILNYTKVTKLKVSFLLVVFSSVITYLMVESTIVTNIFESIKNDTRIMIYSIALDSFLDTLTIGLGIGSLYSITSINIHNYILEILFEFGLVIFLLYFSWLIFIYINLVKVNIPEDSLKILVSYLMLNILLIPFWGGISSTITSSAYIWSFYAFLIISASRLGNRKKRGDNFC